MNSFLILIAAVIPVDSPKDRLGEKDMQRAIQYVISDQPKLTRATGCTNCHHTAFREWGLREALDAGWEVDEKLLEESTDKQLATLQKRMDGYHGKQWSHSLSMFFVLAQKDAPLTKERNKVFDELAKVILERQTSQGSWKTAGQFGDQRPKEEGEVLQTLWGILALAKLEDRDGVKAAKHKALKWLGKAPKEVSIDARVLRVLVEQDAKNFGKRDALVQKLLAEQLKDGGWNWRAGKESDAWSTGLVLWCLSEVEKQKKHKGRFAKVYSRAHRFLAKSKQKNGTWFVESKNKKVKSSEMSTYFGNVWAIIGVARTQN